MSVKKLEDHLRSLGEKEVAQIKKEKDESLEVLRGELDEMAKKAVFQIKQEGMREAESTKRKIIARAKIEAKEKVESEKIRIIDKALEGASDKILKGSDAKKKQVLEALAKEATKGLKDAEVYVDKKYVKLLKSAKSKQLGSFGVLVEGSGGGVTIDNTLDSKITRMRDELVPGLVDVLFKDKSRSK